VNAVVTEDVPDDSKVLAPAARVASRRREA
jgi:hypothetical protein